MHPDDKKKKCNFSTHLHSLICHWFSESLLFIQLGVFNAVRLCPLLFDKAELDQYN